VIRNTLRTHTTPSMRSGLNSKRGKSRTMAKERVAATTVTRTKKIRDKTIKIGNESKRIA
jgi:hypothetical protein